MGILYIVPTPVGNMEDMTLRAIRILKEADLVLAEDTRTSGILLKHFQIQQHLMSHHKFNEHGTSASVVERLQAGQTVALISDAGTPGISDPGFFLVREAVRAGIEVQTLPGATAFVPALVSSGLPCRFCASLGVKWLALRSFLFRGFPASEERSAIEDRIFAR